jgi:hypothetical protein
MMTSYGTVTFNVLLFYRWSTNFTRLLYDHKKKAKQKQTNKQTKKKEKINRNEKNDWEFESTILQLARPFNIMMWI